MRYLVNRKTKEHRIVDNPEAYSYHDWHIVEADSEGWIAHKGNECPLPDDCMVDTMWDDGQGGPRMAAGHWRWRDSSITHYKPILAEKVQEPEPTLPADCIETPDLFNRLDAAHQAAAQIPDIIAQIKAKLEQYGHTVVPLSPFVSAEFVEPEPAVETPQQSAVPDKETLRKIFAEYHESAYNPKSEHYRFEHFYKALLKHSRPAKGEK